MRSILACALALIVGATHADRRNYAIETVHTRIYVSASHLGFSKSSGRFHVADGSFVFDADDWSSARVELKIDPAGLDFGNADWNAAMAGAKFFNIVRFPAIEFRSTSVSGAGNTGQVLGELSLLGVTHPVTLDVTFNRIGADPFSAKVTAGFSARATISRSLWGMSAMTPEVGDAVELMFEVEGQRRESAPTPGGKGGAR